MDTKNHLSIIFLDYDPDGINLATTQQSLASIISHTQANYELVHVKNVKGFVCAVNEGLRRATGDYLIVVANDVMILDSDWVEKMTHDNALVGWRLTPFFITGELRPDFACWGMSRSVFETIGYMDEQFKDGYGFDDDDYVFRAREKGFAIIDGEVTLQHLESLTYRTVFKAEKEAMTSRNETLFREKWASKLQKP